MNGFGLQVVEICAICDYIKVHDLFDELMWMTFRPSKAYKTKNFFTG